MARGGPARLLIVAGTVLAQGLLALPFAGQLGTSSDLVSTVAGPPPTPTTVAASTTAPMPTPTTASPAPTAPTAIEPPPLDVAADPDVGAAIPDGAALPLPPVPVADPIADAVAESAPPPTEAVPTRIAAEPSQPATAPSPTPPPTAAPTTAPPTTAPPTTVPPTTVPPPAPPGENVWAVVVGIDDYPGDRHDLRAARNDGAVLVEGLRRNGVPDDHILTLWDAQATVAGVLGAIDWLVANADARDTVVFLYAGHIRDFGGGTEVLVTAERGYIADWYLADRFASLDVRDAWFVIAGCYGGGFDELVGPGRILTAAAAPGQLAYEDDVLGLSFLGEYLLRRGFANGEAGAPTVQAVAAWAMSNLAVDHPDRQLWHLDAAGHTVSLDGRYTDAPVPGAPAGPPTTTCVLVVVCGSRSGPD